VVRVGVYLSDGGDFAKMNEVYAEYFGDNKPTTTTVQVVRLATDPRCLIEINATAVIS